MQEKQQCLVCQKHSGEIHPPGGVIYENDLLYASHAFIPKGKLMVYLGWLMIEPNEFGFQWLFAILFIFIFVETPHWGVSTPTSSFALPKSRLSLITIIPWIWLGIIINSSNDTLG